ncbi:MAG: hypothetical protein MUD11_14545 [Rhodobacteraceae bacterium]|jgi:hypothetical protein|nr:hypothetical protein [Paracoccaceae bacterium]
MKTIALLAVLATSATAQDGLEFQTPSGNIHCVIYAEDPVGVRCDMVKLTQSYTNPPQDCDLDYGSSFYVDVTSKEGQLYCHGDTIILPSMPVLAYGDLVHLDGITCTSKRSGLICTNARGAGFTLTRARQMLF